MTPVMNKPANIELKVQLLSVILFFVLSVNFNAFAQHTFTTIKKNLNPDAVNLEHDLTVNGDSLVLKSDYLFDKIGFLNNGNRKVLQFNPPVFSAQVPVNQFPVGNYTVLVYESDRIIVFRISRLMEYDDVVVLSDVAMNDVTLVNSTEELTSEDISKIMAKVEDMSSTIVMNDVSINNDVKIESSEVDKTSDEKSIGFATSITVKEEKQKGYNITNLEREGTMTREEYRKTHTRPNGKPYNNKEE